MKEWKIWTLVIKEIKKMTLEKDRNEDCEAKRKKISSY